MIISCSTVSFSVWLPMCSNRKLVFDPREVSNVILSKHPGVNLSCGAKMAAAAATSFAQKERQDRVLILRNIFLPAVRRNN